MEYKVRRIELKEPFDSHLTSPLVQASIGPERIFGSILMGGLSSLEEVRDPLHAMGFNVTTGTHLIHQTQLANTGRSGSFLYRTVDGQYLVKTLPPEEKAFFLHILPSYFEVRPAPLRPLRANLYASFDHQHMTNNPNSLLTRFCGLHKITTNKGCYISHPLNLNSLLISFIVGRSTSFVVMQNVLPTDMHIHEQYDLKGSTVNRSVRLAEKDDMGSIAQKDNDFQRKIVLGPKAQAFVEQIEKDCVVLAPCQVNPMRDI